MIRTAKDFSVRQLDALSTDQWDALAELKVSDQQDYWGGSFTESIEAWENGPRDCVLGLCFLLKASPIGMVLFKRSLQAPEWIEPRAASIHGLKIASLWQGQGLGHVAFPAAVDQLRQLWPNTNSLMLAVDADNLAAIAVYRRYGMVDLGRIFQGKHGPEHRMSFAL